MRGGDEELLMEFEPAGVDEESLSGGGGEDDVPEDLRREQGLLREIRRYGRKEALSINRMLSH